MQRVLHIKAMIHSTRSWGVGFEVLRF